MPQLEFGSGADQMRLFLLPLPPRQPFCQLVMAGPGWSTAGHTCSRCLRAGSETSLRLESGGRAASQPRNAVRSISCLGLVPF